MNKKILYLYSKLTPNAQSGDTLFAGGAQKRVFQMAVYFKAQGFDVFLGSDDSYNSLIVEQLNKHGVCHINVPFRQGLSKKIVGFLKLLRTVRKNKIDIIHCNDRFTSLFGKIVSIFSKAKMIYTARAIFIDKKNTKWLFGNNIIAVSNAVKSNLMDFFGIPSEHIRVIYNGTDLCHASKCEINNVLEKYMLNKENRIISAIGRLSEVKGYSFLIQALLAVKNDYPSIKLLIVGDGELKSELKELVFKLKLDDYVIFCGNQKNVQVFYDISEFTVMSSLWEGMPGAAIESIMLGTPVIGTNVGGIPEIIENNINGLVVPPKDSIALAKAIIYLLSNPQLVKEMGIAGKNIANEKFTLEKMMQNYSNYYVNLN